MKALMFVILLFCGCGALTHVDYILDKELTTEVTAKEVFRELPDYVTVCKTDNEENQNMVFADKVAYIDIITFKNIKAYVVRRSLLKSADELKALMEHNELPKMYPTYTVPTSDTFVHFFYLLGGVNVNVKLPSSQDMNVVLKNLFYEEGWNIGITRNSYLPRLFHLTPRGESKYMNLFDIVRLLEKQSFVDAVEVTYIFQ